MQEPIDLAVGHVLLWFDWMQNLTTPMANVETGSMFYGQTRMEMYIFGCLEYHRLSTDSDVQVKHDVFISPIIEHIALFSDVMLDIVKERLLGKSGSRRSLSGLTVGRISRRTNIRPTSRNRGGPLWKMCFGSVSSPRH